jgi:glyoxylase-like metal-dependent hydrolase (beta-lactamase superfamily II)
MPRHVYAHYYLANLFYIQKNFQKSLHHMEQAVGQFDFMKDLSDYADQQEGKKIDSFQRMMETEWDSTSSCRELRRLETLSAEIAHDLTEKELLAQQRKRIQDQQKAHYLYFFGNVFFQLQRFPEAAQKYKEAIEINPRHASAYNNLTAIFYLNKEFPAAMACLERAEQQGLEDNLNMQLKHLVYEALGRPTEGILREDLSPQADNDIGVMRFALAFQPREAMSPPLYENAYIVFSKKSGQTVIVDPGVNDCRMDDFIRERNLKVRAILNTHEHPDHTGADGYFSGLFGAPVYASKIDAKNLTPPPDTFLADGETLDFDGLSIRVFQTPGHTRGSLCFLIGDFLFSGDTLFRNDIGKVWTEDKGEIDKVRNDLVRSIKEKLLVLPDRTRVCPGHGRTSTIAAEKAGNPFLKK